MQLTLVRKAEDMTHPFFYERRSKDWEASRKRSQIRSKYGKRMIRNDEAARAYLATFLQRPFEAAQRGRYIFYEFGTDSLYQDIFAKGLRIEDLAVADEISQVVNDNMRGIRGEFKKLTEMSYDRTLSQDENTRLKNSSYLVHASWYLMALIFRFIQMFVPKEDARRLFTFDRPISEAKRETHRTPENR